MHAMSIPRWFTAVLAVVVGCWLATTPALAQSAENVAVVINDNSDASRRIGEHYAKTRGLPASNVLRIRTITDDAIGRAEYVGTIERPLGQAIRRAGLQDRLLYLVLTKGVPLRILGTSGITGTVASVDSELTLLYRRLVGTPVAVDGGIDNPYYLGAREIGAARPFSHREHDIYLVTRIDAYTVDQAIALIDRAQAPVKDGRIVLDQRGSGVGDQWMAEAASRLSAQGHAPRVLLENTAKPARGEKPVLGYYSWGASDPANRVRSVGMGFAPGAIAANLASFDARTFRQPPDNWQPTGSPDKAAWFQGSADALVGDLIRDGVSGVSGQVEEAYAFGALRPEILFPAYLTGFNLAEAYYLATPFLSWQAVVIGDPLIAPFEGKRLSRDEIEDPPDPATGYPGLFAKRRSAALLTADPDVAAAAIPALMRAQALQEQGDSNGARRALEEVVAKSPAAWAPLLAIAQLDEALGDHDAAIERYRKVIELRPNEATALNNLAYALAVRRNAPAEALPLAERAARAAPGNPAVFDTVAWIHYLLGNTELAAKLYEPILRLAPGQPEIRLHAALVYMAVGNIARAEVELKEAVRLDPMLESRQEVQRLRLQLRR
jgi:uncharacterized protein (TIGR03790 family)